MSKHYYIIAFFLLVGISACKRKDFYQDPIDRSLGRPNPTITLNGSDSVKVYLGDTLVDPGATAYDYDGNPLVVLKQTNLNYNQMGYYYVNYIATDAYGKQASVKRIVNLTVKGSHYVGGWNVNGNCRTNTLINMLDNNATITEFLSILTIDHNGQIITARVDGQDITVLPSTISVLTANIYEFTGTGRMADDGDSFTIDYTYTRIAGLAGNGSCSATYTK